MTFRTIFALNTNFEYKHTVNQNFFACEKISQSSGKSHIVVNITRRALVSLFNSFDKNEVTSFAPFFRFDSNEERTDHRRSCVGCVCLERGKKPPRTSSLHSRLGPRVWSQQQNLRQRMHG